jgi:hypothetical protein
MMQVMCINNTSKWWSDIMSAPSNGPAYRQVCDVIKEVKSLWNNGYVLDGYGDEPYDARLFIPLSKPVVVFEEEMELQEA